MTGGVFNNENGLVAGHTYTILGVNEVHQQNQATKLVRLRNPWVTDKYTGPWNNDDPQLKEKAAELGDHHEDKEGIFYMPLSVFKKMFGSFSIAMYQNNWILSNVAFFTVPEHEKTLVTKLINHVQ